MKSPIRIHSPDTEEQAHARHLEIQKRLEELGPEAVRGMIGHGFPTQWNPIIYKWLAGEKLEEKPASDGKG
jgi:hypothetical protein